MARAAKALGHPIRVQIVRFLLAQDSCMCGDIVEHLPLAQSTVSQHLKVLKEAGLIRGEIDGPRVCYCVEPGGARASRSARRGSARASVSIRREEVVHDRASRCSTRRCAARPASAARPSIPTSRASPPTSTGSPAGRVGRALQPGSQQPDAFAAHARSSRRPCASAARRCLPLVLVDEPRGDRGRLPERARARALGGADHSTGAAVRRRLRRSPPAGPAGARSCGCGEGGCC